MHFQDTPRKTVCYKYKGGKTGKIKGISKSLSTRVKGKCELKAEQLHYSPTSSWADCEIEVTVLMISMLVKNRAQCIDKPRDSFASCSSRILVRTGESTIFVRKQAIRCICKGCIPSQNHQTYHLCGKMQSSKRKTKIRGNQKGWREHDDTPMDITQAGVWQILQLCIHNNTMSTASWISLQSYTLNNQSQQQQWWVRARLFIPVPTEDSKAH